MRRTGEGNPEGLSAFPSQQFFEAARSSVEQLGTAQDSTMQQKLHEQNWIFEPRGGEASFPNDRDEPHRSHPEDAADRQHR